jgi:hypothetical protein
MWLNGRSFGDVLAPHMKPRAERLLVGRRIVISGDDSAVEITRGSSLTFLGVS